MNEEKYEKMDRFVDEMNASVAIVGDMSVYIFSKFRQFGGYLFIAITMVAIAFIVSEFVRGFQFSPLFGIDVYYIALGISSIVGAYLAFLAEEAKITTIKGAIFSVGSNRFWQFCAAFVVIAVLIGINAKGVQKIADFSLRYLNNELENSVVYKLQEKKMNTHTVLATKTSTSSGVGSLFIQALQKSRDSMVRAKEQEIRTIQAASDNYINGRDKRAYRTLIANKRVQTAQLISKVEDKWAKKIAKLDWKISQAEEKIATRKMQSNKMRNEEINKADEAANELIAYYKKESGVNKDLVEQYKDIGIIVAVLGEIIDGALAFILFMVVKSNPNVEGKLQVQKNTRTILRREESIKSHDIEGKTTSKSSHFYLKNRHEPLSNNLFYMIKKESEKMANEKNEIITVDGFDYLNHPTQRELISRFKQKKGINITPLHVQEYFQKMGSSLTFLNQNAGFVYNQTSLENVA